MSQLLDKHQIAALSKLDLHDIRRALEAGGYPDVDHEIRSVKFVGINEHCQFVYHIHYPGCEGTTITGFVFVRQVNGRPEATY